MSNLKVFNEFIKQDRTQNHLASVLRDKKDSFVTNLVALVSSNKMLQECDPPTVMFAAIKATALNLTLDSNLGLAYVLPYRDNKSGTTLAQFQLGYKGIIQLAQRSGQLKTVNVVDVRDGEIEDEDFISGEIKFKKLPIDKRLDAKVIGYVAYFKLLNGFEKTMYMTVEELSKHGKRYSKAYGFIWTSDFDAMAKKTVLKLLLSKYAPLSVEMQDGLRSDQGVLRSEDNIEYVDNKELVEDIKGQEVVSNLFAQAIEDESKDDGVNKNDKKTKK